MTRVSIAAGPCRLQEQFYMPEATRCDHHLDKVRSSMQRKHSTEDPFQRPKDWESLFILPAGST